MKSKLRALDRNNIVELSQKDIQDIHKSLSTEKSLSSYTYLVERKLFAAYAARNWLKQYHLPLKLEGIADHIQNKFKLLSLPFVDNLSIGDFKVCVLLCDDLLEEAIYIPQIAVDLPQLAAHIYIITHLFEEEVTQNDSTEELNSNNLRAKILGFVRHDQLTKIQSRIQYDEETKEYLVPNVELQPNYSALHTCIKYMNPDRILTFQDILTPQLLSHQIKQAVAVKLSQNLVNRIAQWKILDLTIAEAALVLDDEELQQTLLQENQEKNTKLINLYEWFKDSLEGTVDYIADVFTPRQFIGAFQDDDTDISKDCIRELLIAKSLPEDRCKLKSEKIHLGDFDYQYTIVAWSTQENLLQSQFDLLVMLVPIDQYKFPKDLRVSIEQGKTTCQEIVPEFDSNYQLPLQVDLRGKLAISFSCDQYTYTETFYFKKELNNNQNGEY